MPTTQEKYQHLREELRALGSVAVAFSGGVDSTFLLRTAHDVLGDRAIAVTARSCSFPERELSEARAFCQANGIPHFICDSEELNIDGFRKNPKNRCYLCKHELFGKIWEIARKNGIQAVAEGSNTDDEGDYRPGLLAVRELGVKSPLREAGLSKAEIRELSKALGLPTWNKQSFACLASRFVYGETISENKLRMVDRAEQLLLDLGLTQVRVRIHGTIARIEVLPEDFGKLLKDGVRQDIYRKFQSYGFTYVTLDLLGYRTGSMNETLGEEAAGTFPAKTEANRFFRGGKTVMPDRFSRTELLLGKAAMEKLASSRVAVFGLGGVGGYAVEALARSGVGAIDLIDNDRICLTNLNRQLYATERTMGRYKADAAAERVLEINPNVRVRTYKVFYTPETAGQFDFSAYDYIIDAIDTVTGKLALAVNADKAGTPIISSMGAGNKLDPTAFEVADIYSTSVCPLARVMRRELKRRGIRRLKVVYSKEPPLTPGEDMSAVEDTQRRQTPGSTAFVPSVAGLIIAGEVVKDLTQQERLRCPAGSD